MKGKIVEYRGDFHEQWRINTHRAYYITSREEFIHVVWAVVKFLDISPMGMGSWEQEGAKEYFFNNGYSSYLMSGSVKDFMGEDWYIFEYERCGDNPAIFAIKLETIKERHASFMRQFN